jgi:peptidoglycan hydrolase-like protein with peptidoglycan-binding domain
MSPMYLSGEVNIKSYPELVAPLKDLLGAEYAHEFEYEGGGAAPAPLPDRNSKTYIVWVQRALNQVLDVGLDINGELRPVTRSAIRCFQQRRRIRADGIMNATTEAALKLALARTPVRPALAVAQGPLHLGLDFASVDENINPNWVKAKAQIPINFVFLRANYATWQDPQFLHEWPRIKDAGIVRGAYLFLVFPSPKYPKVPDPVLQAKVFVKTVRKLDHSDFPPSLDVEFPGGRAATKMEAPQLLKGVRAAWKVLKDAYGVAPFIYTSARVWREDLKNPDAPDLRESPLWLTPYPFCSNTRAVREPRSFVPGGRYFPPPVPRPWGDTTNWWIHQYQGDAWELPGFRQVDMDRFNTTIKGAAGDRIKWMQRRLGIPQSGMFDAATETVVRSFQRKNGLTPDGVVDPRTFAFFCWSNP